MRIPKVVSRFLVTTILILTMCEMSSCVAASNRAGGQAVKPANRADSVRTLVRHLGLGQGSVIADIGADAARIHGFLPILSVERERYSARKFNKTRLTPSKQRRKKET